MGSNTRRSNPVHPLRTERLNPTQADEETLLSAIDNLSINYYRLSINVICLLVCRKGFPHAPINSRHSTPPRRRHRCYFAQCRTFVAVGYSGVTTSTDGITRTAVVIGHSGTLNDNSRENVELSRQRAANVIGALRGVGAKGPFALASAGALDPVTTTKTEAAQAKNRRVVIVLVP